MKKLLLTTLLFFLLSPIYVGAEIYVNKGLVGWYTFDNTRWVTNVVDSSGSGNTAYAKFAGTLGTTTQSVGGVLAQGLLLNGTTNAAVQIVNSTSIKPATNLTISVWVNPDINSLGATGQLRELYRLEASDRYLFSFQNGANCTTPVSSPGGCISLGLTIGGVYAELDVKATSTDYEGKWTLMTATYDGSTKKIYANGKLLGSIAASGAIGTTGAANPWIGSNGNTIEVFKGRLDDVRIYNTALSQADISQLYYNGVGRHMLMGF